MRTVTVEVPEGHMVKIVKEESMQSTQKVMGGGEKLHSPSHSSPKGNELPRVS